MARKLSRIVRQNLQRIRQPGFLRGISVVDINNPTIVRIWEEWGSRHALRDWIASPIRKRLQDEVLDLTSGPESWRLAIYREAW